MALYLPVPPQIKRGRQAALRVIQHHLTENKTGCSRMQLSRMRKTNMYTLVRTCTQKTNKENALTYIHTHTLSLSLSLTYTHILSSSLPLSLTISSLLSLSFSCLFLKVQVCQNRERRSGRARTCVRGGRKVKCLIRRAVSGALRAQGLASSS